MEKVDEAKELEKVIIDWFKHQSIYDAPSVETYFHKVSEFEYATIDGQYNLSKLAQFIINSKEKEKEKQDNGKIKRSKICSRI